MILLNRYYWFILIVLLLSCESKNKIDDVLLAKVYTSALYQSDIDEFLKEDTVSYNKKRFIDSWVRNELYLNSAELTKSDKREIDQLTKSFEKTLIIQKQKEKYLVKNLDTSVDMPELQSAYDELKESYKLKKDIFKYHLVVVEKGHPEVLDIKNFFKRREYDKFYESIGDVTNQYLDSTSWHNWFDISMQLPKDEIDESDISGEMNEVLESVDHVFFLRIFDFVDKTETAPLSYMKRYLENALVEKRKEKLIEEYSSKLYQSALNNNKIILN